MNFISTRGHTPPHSFSQAVEAGLAPDGGLFWPETIPDLSGCVSAWRGMDYPELAADFLSRFAPEIPPEEWHSLTREAYAQFTAPEVAHLRPLSQQTMLLELFHGPTLAFKDFALQLLGRLCKRRVKMSGQQLCVLGATSGDTGSAAIHGCMGQPGIDIFILYPDGRISPLQERQMACTQQPNVFAIPIPGTFDDAQAVVKEVFGDAGFAQRVNLSAVNSINISRVLAQCVYYIWAWLRLPEEWRENVEFVVPTGNFGNVLAGWMAQQMGILPPGVLFRVATSKNDILHRFFTTGEYASDAVSPSHAPSMDIQRASNFERFAFVLTGNDTGRVRALAESVGGGLSVKLPLPASTFTSSRMDDQGIVETIRRVWETENILIDPHTACAFADRCPDRPRVILSTAHPAKFPDVVRLATGQEPTHEILERLKPIPPQRHSLPADAAAVKEFILASRHRH
jgi:threonine synthase